MDKNNAMDIITQNYNLHSFLAKSLPISSKSLYYSFLNPPHENKKKKHLNSALINYLKRACTRTTPYGLMSGVALARFSDNTQIKINSKEYNEDIQVDYHWLNNVIYNLEKNPELIKQLRTKFNSSCYTWGNRMKNPYYTIY